MIGIAWTPAAAADLRAISDWLTEHSEGDRAVRLLETIRLRADLLSRFPYVGRPHDRGLRLLRVLGTPYLIVYRPMESGIQIIRVHHERQNYRDAP